MLIPVTIADFKGCTPNFPSYTCSDNDVIDELRMDQYQYVISSFLKTQQGDLSVRSTGSIFLSLINVN